MLIGYSKDDRIMDPAGAFRLYKAATNSKRDMVEGTGHAQASNAGGPREAREPIFPDWAMKTIGAARLRSADDPRLSLQHGPDSLPRPILCASESQRR